MLRGIKGLTIALCAAMSLLALDATAARFYKSVDENGKVIFSDRPASSADEQIDVKVFTPDVPAPAVPTAKKPDEKTKKDGDAKDDKNEAKADLKALQSKRDENCKKAKSRLQKLQTVSRLYSEDGKGNRTYVSDEERMKQLTDARASIKEWCK